MSLYVESSGVLRWLLNEPDPDGVIPELLRAPRVLTSELTILECRRALARLVSVGALDPAVASRRGDDLARVVPGWDMFPVDSLVLSRAAEAWPREPVRSLDAIHLATAVLARGAVPDLRMLTLDQRVRENATAVGIPLVPP